MPWHGLSSRIVQASCSASGPQLLRSSIPPYSAVRPCAISSPRYHCNGTLAHILSSQNVSLSRHPASAPLHTHLHPPRIIPRGARNTIQRYAGYTGICGLTLTSNTQRMLPRNQPTRSLSLSSISSVFRSSPTPSAHVLSQLVQLETVANAEPTSVPAQLAYFHGLINSNLKGRHERIISRWERAIRFDPRSPLLRSDEAFQLYLTALVRAGHNASVNHAVQQRDLALLQVTNSEAPITSTTNVGPPSNSQAASSSTGAPVQPSKSQEIAQSILSTQSLSAVSTGYGGTLSSGSSASSANVTPLQGGIQGVAKDNPIYVTISEPKGSAIYRFMKFLVLTAAGVFILAVVLAVLVENSGLMKAGPQSAEFEPAVGKTVKFSDVHGVDEAKDELQEVVEFLKDPAQFATLGGKLPKGVLLTGPPGTGKTMLARAVAGEAGVPFLFASGSEFDEMFVGVGAKRIRDLFAMARKKQPAIIFIDELDAIGSKRSNRDQHYMKQTLNQLLVELDGFQQTEGVIVIAATNFPQSLDQALVRPGRFDRKIAVPLPDVKGRAQILKHHMRDVIVAEDVDNAILARGTAGFSGADLQNLVNYAAVQASREGFKAVLLKHFEWAKDRIIMGAERRSAFIDDKVKRLTAYHEAGHALVALYTDGAMPLHKVTCMPRGDALGWTAQLPEDDRHSVSYKEYRSEIDVCMGGRLAEEIIYGLENVTSGCVSDLEHATSVATRMVQNWGFSEKVGPMYYDEQDISLLSPQRRTAIENEIRDLVHDGAARARDILVSKENELHRLANALIEHETLDLDEVKKVIKGEAIRVNEDLA